MKIRTTFFASLLVAIVVMMTVAVPVLAQETGDPSNSGDPEQKGDPGPPADTTPVERIPLKDPLGRQWNTDEPVAQQLSIFLGETIARVIAPIGAVAFLLFVIGGFFWIFSGGNEERIKQGRAIMVWTVVGLAVIFSAYLIVSFVFSAFGIQQ